MGMLPLDKFVFRVGFFDKTVFHSEWEMGVMIGFCTLVLSVLPSQTKAREQCPDVQGEPPPECPSSII